MFTIEHLRFFEPFETLSWALKTHLKVSKGSKNLSWNDPITIREQLRTVGAGEADYIPTL